MSKCATAALFNAILTHYISGVVELMAAGTVILAHNSTAKAFCRIDSVTDKKPVSNSSSLNLSTDCLAFSLITNLS
jgi:hypothetical protein